MPPKPLIKVAQPTDVTIGPGQTQDIPSGATVTNVIVNGGTQIIENGGKAISTIVVANGYQSVLAGGYADGSKLATGGTAPVYGTAINTVIQKDGRLLTLPGGHTINSVVNSGGIAQVSGGDFNDMGDRASVINNGGHMFVGAERGGVVASAYAPLINQGGTLTVYDDGIINIATIQGGSLQAHAGSFITGPLYLKGGTVTIDTNVSFGTQPINFSTGNLILNGLPTNGAAYIHNNFRLTSDIINPTDQRTLTFLDDFNGILGTTRSAYHIFNIADGIKIDLAGMKFLPAVTIAKITADKLMVTNNISTFEIPLTGNINGAIATSNDGNGGTLVEVMKSVAIVGAAAPASLDVGHHFV